MNSRYKGIFFITLSALSFAFMNAFVRLSGDLPSVQKSFFRNLVAFLIALIMIIRSKDGFKIEKGNLKYMILRATFGTVGILCNFYAVDHLVLSDASMLNKMSPFFVIIFSFLLLKEKMSPAQALAVAGAFIGSLFVIKPTFTNMALVPSLIGLCGYTVSPGCVTCAAPCGNTDDYDMENLWKESEEIGAFKNTILMVICQTAAKLYHADQTEESETVKLLFRALRMISFEGWDVAGLIPVMVELGKAGRM